MPEDRKEATTKNAEKEKPEPKNEIIESDFAPLLGSNPYDNIYGHSENWFD